MSWYQLVILHRVPKTIHQLVIRIVTKLTFLQIFIFSLKCLHLLFHIRPQVYKVVVELGLRVYSFELFQALVNRFPRVSQLYHAFQHA